MGLRPLLMSSAFKGFESTPITSCPASAKHAAETHPTYPRPNMLNFIDSSPKMYRRLSNLRMARLRNRSIATERLNQEALRRLDNLRYRRTPLPGEPVMETDQRLDN